jgi:hypothetical protein
MDKKLHLLDSFGVHGSDGADYKVCAYEHLVRDPSATAVERWEPAGVTEYRLSDGRPVEETRSGTMRIVASGVELSR